MNAMAGFVRDVMSDERVGPLCERVSRTSTPVPRGPGPSFDAPTSNPGWAIASSERSDTLTLEPAVYLCTLLYMVRYKLRVR
jgi:hypothetical protein